MGASGQSGAQRRIRMKITCNVPRQDRKDMPVMCIGFTTDFQARRHKFFNCISEFLTMIVRSGPFPLRAHLVPCLEEILPSANSYLKAHTNTNLPIEHTVSTDVLLASGIAQFDRYGP